MHAVHLQFNLCVQAPYISLYDCPYVTRKLHMIVLPAVVCCRWCARFNRGLASIGATTCHMLRCATSHQVSDLSTDGCAIVKAHAVTNLIWLFQHCCSMSFGLCRVHCIALHCIASPCIAWHGMALHCIALHCIGLNCNKAGHSTVSLNAAAPQACSPPVSFSVLTPCSHCCVVVLLSAACLSALCVLLCSQSSGLHCISASIEVGNTLFTASRALLAALATLAAIGKQRKAASAAHVGRQSKSKELRKAVTSDVFEKIVAILPDQV